MFCAWLARKQQHPSNVRSLVPKQPLRIPLALCHMHRNDKKDLVNFVYRSIESNRDFCVLRPIKAAAERQWDVGRVRRQEGGQDRGEPRVPERSSEQEIVRSLVT